MNTKKQDFGIYDESDTLKSAVTWGPVGIEALAATLGEERQTIEDCYEPYLLQAGFLTRTTRGRVVTKLAYEYLNIERCKNLNF